MPQKTPEICLIQEGQLIAYAAVEIQGPSKSQRFLEFCHVRNTAYVTVHTPACGYNPTLDIFGRGKQRNPRIRQLRRPQ